MHADEFHLTDAERFAQRRRRRRVISLVFALVIVLVLGALVARPTRHAIRGLQSRRHATKAFALIEKQDWTGARDEATAAYQLRPTEPEALRAVARLLSRVRQPQALEFWDQLGKVATLSPEDLRDEGTIALIAGETQRAEAATSKLIEHDPQPVDWLLDAQVAARTGDVDRAIVDCEKVAAASGATTREQLQSAGLELALLRDAPKEKTKPVWLRISKLAQGDDAVSLDALMFLAQRVLPARQEDVAIILPPSSVIPSPEALALALEHHPLARAPHKLIALDLREHSDPSQRQALIDRGVAQWSNASLEDVAALALWLNGKREYQRVIDSIRLDQVQKNRDLFLQYLDALGALGRWTDVERLLEGEGFPLEPYLQSMYLARSNAQLGAASAAANNWQRAVESAAGDVIKLMQVGDFAEKNGVLDTADSAYAAVLDQNSHFRAAYQGRLRIAQARRQTKQMHELLAAMLKLWPNETAIQNDEAYTRLLLLPANLDVGDPVGQALPLAGATRNGRPTSFAEELRSIEKLAEKLVQREPKSLPHRTLLALARLRHGLPQSALDAYGIEVPDEAITPSALAVRAAALAANGRTEEARSLIANLRPEQLLPEEEALIEPIRSENEHTTP